MNEAPEATTCVLVSMYIYMCVCMYMPTSNLARKEKKALLCTSHVKTMGEWGSYSVPPYLSTGTGSHRSFVPAKQCKPTPTPPRISGPKAKGRRPEAGDRRSERRRTAEATGATGATDDTRQVAPDEHSRPTSLKDQQPQPQPQPQSQHRVYR